MKLPLAVPFLSLLLFACAGHSDDAADTTDDALQGGVVDKADPAVGLVWFQGGGFCTGTVIAPTVILTAGHCVQDPIDGFYTGPGTATAQVGATPPRGMVKHAVKEWKAHPSFDPSFGSCPNAGVDIGLIHLSAPISTPALAINTGHAPAVGTSCTAIGYGTHTERGKTTFEQKRKGTEKVAEIHAQAVGVTFGNAIADRGDSGGPLLCGTTIAATTSCSAAPGDPNTVNYYARVDAGAAWVQQTLAQWH
jgi:V8-like Glu-specific endopeptidase